MSSNVLRLGLLAGIAALLAGAIGLAQQPKGGEPAVGGRVDVYNSVEGRVVVVTSRPDGARVEKGDIICELDPTEIRIGWLHRRLSFGEPRPTSTAPGSPARSP